MNKQLLIVFFILITSSCSFKENTKHVYSELCSKEFIIPNNATWVKDIKDTIPFNYSTKFRILNYIDSVGCLRCKSQLPLWKKFIDKLDSITENKISVMIFMHPAKYMDAIYAVKKDNYPYPVCIDLNDEINKLNHFPDDDRFRCFLLDENNRVVLIGNPVQNPKIKDLYIRTICKGLNINYSSQTKNNPRKNLGVFSQNETKTVQFEIKNPDKKVLLIDSVFTSCECTTAKIDKKEILQNESAVLSVTYKPDGIGDFYREIYVKIHDEEKPKIFEIEGKVE